MADRPSQVAVRGILERHRPDVVNLWVDAISKYKEILGDEAKDLNTKFNNVDDMINFGNDRSDIFCFWRHDDSKMDKIRKIFISNIDLIDVGTQKIIAAATPAFPPASIISTALTFVLAGCKSVSADYNVVTGFFTEMNSFLNRIKILEGKLPRSKEYQTCLTDVFTSLLIMCAYATKFIKKGRMRKWIVNSFLGEDGDLAGARGGVEKNLGILHSATQFAILANTEQSNDLIRELDNELKKNAEIHEQLVQDQQMMLAEVRKQQEINEQNFEIIKTILRGQKDQQKTSVGNRDEMGNKAKGIRSIISENYENIAELKILQENRERQTCDWLFGEIGWQTWSKTNGDSTVHPVLTLHGAPGIGKSHLAAAAYDYLRQSAGHESSNKVCVASFFCRKGFATLNSLQDLINSTVLQVSDQNSLIYEQINAELAKDEVIRPKDYFDRLLRPIFRKGSNYTLYIIVDAVNEFETDDEISALIEIIEKIKTQGLNIKLLITNRDLLRTIAGTEILIDKSKVLPDLVKIIEARLDSTDSAFEGLRRLHIHVKNRIQSELEAKADGPLYISVALRYLSNIGREGAIMRELKNSLPDSAAGFLEKDMSQCWRRTPENRVKAVEVLLAWLTFGFETLTLDGGNALVRMYSADQDFFIEDEVEGVYGRVIQLASTTGLAALDEPGDPVNRVSEPDSLEEIESFDDRGYLVAFRHRALRDLLSTRAFFTGEYESWLSSSAAHRAMFLLCFQLIRDHQKVPKETSPSTGLRDLHDYATRYCLRHWQNIDCEQHTVDENIDILESFAILLQDRRYLAAQIEAKGYDHSIDLLVSTHQHADDESWFQKFLDGWDRWSRWVSKNLSSANSPQHSRINSELRGYWSSKTEECMLPLAKAHVDNWLSATEDYPAQTSYYFARKTVMMTSLRKELFPEFPDDEWKNREEIRGRKDFESIKEIYVVRDFASPTIDGNAALATALIIRAYGFLDSREFVKEISISESSKDSVQLYQCNVLDAEHRQQQGQDGSALIRIRKVLNEDRGVPSSWIAKALRMFAELEYEKEEVESAYERIRTLPPPFFVPADILLGEFQHYHYYGSPAEVLSFFKKLTKIQRLTLLSCHWFGLESKTHRWLEDAAKEVDMIDELIHEYDKIVGALDQEGSGAAWSRYLAHLHRSFKGNNETAKEVLGKALDIPCKTRKFELFQLDTGLVAMQLVNAMSDIIYEQFRNSTEPNTKRTHLTEVRALLQLPLPQCVQINLTSTIPHTLVIANMVRKIGSPEEWQKELQSAFDIVWANLHDTIAWNDGINLGHLSRILAQIPSLLRDAQIVNSAQRSFRDETSAFLKFLKRHKQEKLYDPETETRLKKWIEGHPKFRKYVRDNTIRWDTPTNDFVNVKSAKSVRERPDKGEEYWFNRFVETRFGWKDSEIEGLSAACTCARCHDRIDLLQGQETYTCLLCTDSMLCRECFDLRISMNRNKGLHQHETRFCCAGERYLESPVAGWEGIRDGKMYLKGQEPVEWKDYLERVKTRWDEAWVEFWRN